MFDRHVAGSAAALYSLFMANMARVAPRPANQVRGLEKIHHDLDYSKSYGNKNRLDPQSRENVRRRLQFINSSNPNFQHV